MAEPRVYFAHPVSDYGTARELDALAAIQREFPGWVIENPNTEAHAAAYRERGMEHFAEVVGSCQSLVAWPFEDGAMGAGVWKEIEAARANKIPVYVLRSRIVPLVGTWDVLSVEDTRARIARGGRRG